MKKYLLPLLLLGACAPDIAQDNNGPSGDAILVQFDPTANPPALPLPNDIVGHDPATKKLTVPKLASDSPAQAEFNQGYLNSLDGFPFESTGTVDFSGELRGDTVTGANVLAYDLGVDGKGVPMPVAIGPTYVNKRVSIPAPGVEGWTRGHHYAIVLVGGDAGLRGSQGQPVLGTATFGLLSSKSSLVTCKDLKTDCRPSVDIIPSMQSDPAAKLAEQTAAALQLEASRLALAPVLDFLEGQGKPREIIPMAWTFTVVDAAEVTFDPSHNTIPFPNDILRDPATKKVKLPNPNTFLPLAPADCVGATDASVQLVCGLNTLDGFSTIAPPISENGEKVGAIGQSKLDPKSLTAASVGLAKVASNAAAGTTLDTAVNFTPCIDCQSSKDAMGNPPSGPQTLQWSLNAPLDEQSTYLAWTTNAMLDTGGKQVVAAPTFALLKLTNSLLTTDGKSAVSILSDDQAKQLEPLRAALKPAIDGLDARGVKRDTLTLAFAFTTQSEGSVLDTIRGLIAAQTPAALPDVPLPPPASASPADVAFTDVTPAAFGGAAKMFETNIVTPLAVTGPSGTLDPANPKPKLVAVDIIVPTGEVPAGGFRVNIFGHGFTRSRNDALALAAKAAITDRQVIVMMDWLDHGNDRSSCTGSKLATGFPTDDGSCANPTAGPQVSKCDEDPLQGLCVLVDRSAAAACTGATSIEKDLVCMAQGQGFCAADGKCQGAGARLLQDNDLPPSLGGVPGSNRPLISGWNIINLANFFQTRDNFRQAVIDFTQLVRVIKSTSTANFATRVAASMSSATPVIDTTKIGYVGQSLGGILGTLVNSVSPDTDNVVLNVPGGAIPQIVLNATDTLVGKLKAGLLAALAAQGIQQGTPRFDQFIAFSQWIMDPADPANLGYRLTHPVNGAPNANRKVFIQFIQGDPTVPNISNFALVAGANRTFNPAAPPSFGCQAPLSCYEFTEAGDAFDANSVPVSTRHGFLLNGNALTPKAQTQASTFLATGIFTP